MNHKIWLLFVLVTINMLINGIIAYPDHLYCEEEFSAGYGKKKIVRYYFDNVTQQCDIFIYSGRGGTLNNFATLDKCIRTCENVKRIDL